MGQSIGAVAGGVTSLFGGRARRAEEKQSRADFNKRQDEYNNFEFTNQYAGLENTAEDLTVNRQSANFQGQQTDQALSQGLDAITQTGGGGGGAQAIANAALQSKQGISADLSRQESGNRQLRSQQAASNQLREAQGAENVQNQQFERTTNQYSIASDRFAAAKEARQKATSDLVGGIVGGVSLFAGGGGFGAGGFSAGTLAQNAGLGAQKAGAGAGAQFDQYVNKTF